MHSRTKKWPTANFVNGVVQEGTLREALEGGSKLLLCRERKKTPTRESFFFFFQASFSQCFMLWSFMDCMAAGPQ